MTDGFEITFIFFPSLSSNLAPRSKSNMPEQLLLHLTPRIVSGALRRTAVTRHEEVQGTELTVKWKLKGAFNSVRKTQDYCRINTVDTVGRRE